MTFNFMFTVKEKQMLFSLLAYVHERVERKEELSEDIFYLEDSREDVKDILLEIARKVWLIEVENNEDMTKEDFLKSFREISKDDIRKMLRRG